MDRPLEPGTSSLMFYGYDTDEERLPVRELYGVFRRPKDDADRAAEPLAAVAWSGIPWGPEIAMDEGRVFLSGLGGDEDTIYAAPLGDDRLVFAVLPNGGGGSTRPGPDGLYMLAGQRETGALVVHGIVADSVESVDLVVAGVTHQARMGENGFGLRLEGTHEADQERLVLHRRDGTTNEIGLTPQPDA
jgi:hypothetical protein